MIISIAVTFLLLFYGGIFMMSPMMIAAKGFSDSLSSILQALLLLGYPILLFLLMMLFGTPFYGTPASSWLIGFSIPFALAILFYRIPRLLFNISRGIPNTGYHIGQKAVLLNGRKIKKADPKSFDPMEYVFYYSKDAYHVFYHNRPIPNADPETFTSIPAEGEHEGRTDYWRDKSHVYYHGQIIQDADPESFIKVRSLYAKDRHYMYYNGYKIPDAHPDSFYFLTDGIGIDGLHVFVYGRKSAEQPDISTFEVAQGEDKDFCRDKHHVYLLFYQAPDPLAKVDGADPDTFKILERYYATDASHVYYYGYYKNHTQRVTILKNADPDSFVTGYDSATKSDARDKNACYMLGKVVDTNPNK